MIILDGDVLSALMYTRSDPTARRWMATQPRDDLWTTAVSIVELTSGIDRLPLGQRQSDLLAAFRLFIDQGLDHRIAPLDEPAAIAAGALDARRRRSGPNIGIPDTLIAGIALARNATIATRNVRHFADVGVPLVNPWDPSLESSAGGR